MRISFDIDDTIVCGDGTPCEHFTPWWARSWYPERMREGTRDLLRELRRRGHELWIYTSSFRSPVYLWTWFRVTGIPVWGVVNGDRHERVVRPLLGHSSLPSKYPRAFGIDLHIDDSEGVALEGQEHGFRVLVIAPTDPEWAARVLRHVG